MIEIRRKGANVVLEVETGLPDGEGESTICVFSAFFYSAPLAELMCHYLDDRLRQCIKGIREEAYEQGSRDAKNKKRIEATHFSSALHTGLERGGCY